MKWLLLITQEDYGCDYTIGCGIQFFEFETSTYEEAQVEVHNIIIGNDGDRSGYHGDEKLKDATLYKINEEESVPLDFLYSRYKESQDEISANELRKEEFELYQHLKSKYEGT